MELTKQMVKSNLKLPMVQPRLCDCSDTYILLKRTITITDGRKYVESKNKQVISAI